MIGLTINHVPVPWSAHQGYGKRSYNPKAKEREYYQWQIKSQYKKKELLSCPVSICFTFYMPIPKGTSKVRYKEMLEGKLHHTKRPDIDNLNKFLCDCLKTIVFEDDSQIVHLISKKCYGENPKTVIVIDKSDQQMFHK